MPLAIRIHLFVLSLAVAGGWPIETVLAELEWLPEYGGLEA